MLTHHIGYPFDDNNKELKKACERYREGKVNLKDLLLIGKKIRLQNWLFQQQVGIDLIPSNNFSFHDQVLDMSLTVGAIPERYHPVILNKNNTEFDLYFAMANGYNQEGLVISAMKTAKWFNTNYEYIMPEFFKNQQFYFFSNKIINEFMEAKQAGIITKPVIIGPLSYLLLGKEKPKDFHRIELIKNLLPVYLCLLEKLELAGVKWIQFDEPFLSMNLSTEEKIVFTDVYKEIKRKFATIKIMVTTNFEGLADNALLVWSLPIDVFHINLATTHQELDKFLTFIPEDLIVSLGLPNADSSVENDFKTSLAIINKTIQKLGYERVMLGSSSSLVYSSLDLEINQKLTSDIKQLLAFKKHKIAEVITLKELVGLAHNSSAAFKNEKNIKEISIKKNSAFGESDDLEKTVQLTI